MRLACVGEQARVVLQLTTLDRVCARTQQSRRRWLDTKVLVEAKIKITARVEDLEYIHTGLDEFWLAIDEAHLDLPSSSWRMEFTTAVAEIASNIIRHAYPPVNSERPLYLRLRLYPDRVEARFIDRGMVFQESMRDISETSDPILRKAAWFIDCAAVLDKLDYQRTRGV